MRRAAVVLMLLTGCAMSRPEAEQKPPESSDTTIVQSLEQQQQEQEDELMHPHVAGQAPDCGKVCELASNICALSGRICAITAHHSGEDDMDRACSEAADRCARAKNTAASAPCSCGG
ncbi:MAG: hypothetical protein JST54_33580 [Deltaproteobacteria bacterium]|nr:hypothetical protein [Deltaproteobacteria bacterium]